jgi:hypothetical protein
VERQVTDDHFVSGGTAQLARQAIVVEPYTRVRLPRVLVDRGGLAEVLREARRADLPVEHTGPRGLRRQRAILAAIVASAPPGVVACRRPHFGVAHLESIDDVAGVAVLSLSARIKYPLPDRRSTLVG